MRMSWRQWVRLTAVPAAIAGAAAAWVASRPLVAAAVLAAGAVWQLVIVVRTRGRPSFLFDAVGCTVLAGLAAGCAGGARASTALLPAVLACLLVGLGVAQRTAVRDAAARALARRRPPPEEAATTWRRDRTAIVLALPTFLLALLLAPVATWRIPLNSAGAATPPGTPAENGGLPGGSPPPSRPPLAPPRPSGGAAFSPAAAGTLGPDDPDTTTGDPRSPAPHRRRPDSYKDRRVVMEVKPTRDGRVLDDLGPLYLRGLPVARSGYQWHLTVPPTRLIRDGDDGRADGWCELGVRPRPADGMDLSVHEELTVATPGGGLIAFCPPGTAAVGLPRVNVEPGGVVLAEKPAGTETFDWKLVALIPSRVPFPGPIARIVGADPDAGPPAASDAASAALAATAQRVVQDVSSPVDRVRAVMQHLRATYEYDDKGAPLDDPAALPRLLAEKRGSCTQFAQAGVVMLRAIGIPARIGTGFLASEWNEKNGAYVVRARDSHAWVEVAFEACGWVVFDPTPREPAGAEDGRPEPGAPDDPAVDSPFKPDDAAAADDPVTLERMVGGVRATIGRVLAWLGAHPWLSALAVAAAAALVVRVVRSRGRRLAGVQHAAAPLRGPWERLVTELARRGHRRRASQTALEFAASVVASGGDEFGPLVALTARQQAARFGGHPLGAEDLDAIDALRAAIRRTAKPASS